MQSRLRGSRTRACLDRACVRAGQARGAARAQPKIRGKQPQPSAITNFNLESSRAKPRRRAPVSPGVSAVTCRSDPVGCHARATRGPARPVLRPAPAPARLATGPRPRGRPMTRAPASVFSPVSAPDSPRASAHDRASLLPRRPQRPALSAQLPPRRAPRCAFFSPRRCPRGARSRASLGAREPARARDPTRRNADVARGLYTGMRPPECLLSA